MLMYGLNDYLTLCLYAVAVLLRYHMRYVVKLQNNTYGHGCPFARAVGMYSSFRLIWLNFFVEGNET